MLLLTDYIDDLPEEGLIIETAEVGYQSIQTLTFTHRDMLLANKRDVGPLATFSESSSYFKIVNSK